MIRRILAANPVGCRLQLPTQTQIEEYPLTPNPLPARRDEDIRRGGRRLPTAISPVSRLLLALTICFCSLAPIQRANGAEPADDLDYPLVVINAASFQRLRDNAGRMFESAERADMTDRVDQWTAGALKDTKGLDRTRPFGLMLYLGENLIGPPLAISYLPVTNVDDALATLASEDATITPVEGKPGRYEIQYSESFKLRLLHEGGYLFLVGPDGNDTSLDRNFPNPEKMTARLSSQYDIAVSFLIKSIPIGLKTTFLAFFTSQSKAHLQQRDDEPESVYRLRRANGEGWVDLIEKIVNQGNEITLGGRIDPEKGIAHIDFEVAGTRDSKLAKLFQNMVGKRTYFGNLIDNPSTFTMSVSWVMDEKQRKLFVKYFEAAQKDLGVKDAQGKLPELAATVAPIFKTLMTTADVGHLDAIIQLTGTEQGEFALVGGIKVATSRDLPAQLADALKYADANSSDNSLVQGLDLEFDAIDSHPVHRLQINPPEKSFQRLFGENPSFYVYATPQVVWCAFGAESALDTLKSAVQTTSLPQDVKQNRNRVPFQFITHARNWLAIADDENPNATGFNERARAAFDSDNDAMTIEIRPTDSGVRIRTVFESGFVSLMGRGFSSGIDDGTLFRPRGGGRGARGPEGRRRNPPNPDPAPSQD